MEKHCDVCSEGFSRRIKEGNEDWSSRRFCSLECAYIGRKTNKGRRWSLETRRKMSLAKKGSQPFLGKHHTAETRLKMSLARNGRGQKVGFRHSPSTRERLRVICTGRYNLDQNPNWRGGKSFEPYGLEFNLKLKQQIKQRDGFECVICRTKRDLCIHHIDYDKTNNIGVNLVTVCRSCHSRTNYHRDEWEALLNVTVATRITFELETSR